MSIAILGTGIEAVRILYYYIKKGLPLPTIVSLELSETSYTFLGEQVIHISKIDLSSTYFIVAVHKKEYENTKIKLKLLNLIEFRNYIFCDWYNKKMVLLHGNCHFDVIQEILESNNNFMEKFYIYPIPRIHKIKDCIPEIVLKNCNYYIHEPIYSQNPYGYKLSDDYIFTILPNSTISISIPNLYECGYGFFPLQHMPNPRNAPLPKNNDITGIFPYSLEPLDNLILSGHSSPEIIQQLSNPNLINKNIILYNFNTYMDKIKKREDHCQIKIYDFIIKNYKYQKMFYDPGHPTNAIFIEICNRIFKLLNIPLDESSKNSSFSTLDQCELPILECVKNALNLQYGGANEIIRSGKFAKKINSCMNLTDYVDEYKTWCYNLSEK